MGSHDLFLSKGIEFIDTLCAEETIVDKTDKISCPCVSKSPGYCMRRDCRGARMEAGGWVGGHHGSSGVRGLQLGLRE